MGIRDAVARAQGSSVLALSGTPGFFAPELLEGRLLDRPADVYAFGMSCYQALSKGLVPFGEITGIGALAYQVAVEKRRPLRPEGVSEAIWTFVQRCWVAEPINRPAFETIKEELPGIRM